MYLSVRYQKDPENMLIEKFGKERKKGRGARLEARRHDSLLELVGGRLRKWLLRRNCGTGKRTGGDSKKKKPAKSL